jgi:hypothetical protein
MEDMLHTLHDDRPGLALDVHQALHAQQVRPAQRSESSIAAVNAATRTGGRTRRERRDRAIVARRDGAEVGALAGPRAEPAPDLPGVGPGARKADAGQERRVDLALNDVGGVRAWVERVEPLA